MPAQFASLNFKEETLPMEVDSDDPTVLTGRFNVNISGSYTVGFRTTGNQLNPSPVIYDIIALEDRPPTARFTQPDRPAIKAAANVKLDLVMTGTDDHGVKDATLHVMQGDENLFSPRNVLEGRGPQPEFRAVETLDLATFNLKPGSSLHYWLTVRDNKEPTSNKVDTARQLIEIGEPLPPTEKKKVSGAARRSGIAARDRRRPSRQRNRPSSRRRIRKRLKSRTLGLPTQRPQPRSIKHRQKPTRRLEKPILARPRNRPLILRVPTRMTRNNS